MLENPNQISEVAKIHLTEFGQKILSLIDEEIDEIKGAISNEHTWEFGYDGEEPNPHSQNIISLNEELDFLTSYRVVMRGLTPDKLLETSKRMGGFENV